MSAHLCGSALISTVTSGEKSNREFLINGADLFQTKPCKFNQFNILKANFEHVYIHLLDNCDMTF